MRMQWQRTWRFTKGQELYQLLIPVGDRRAEQDLLNTYDNFRLYILQDQDFVAGLTLIAWLQNSKTLHLDVFGIHPNYRNQGLGLKAYEALVVMLQREWEIENVSIEAYLYNSNFFTKIWNMSVVVFEYQPLYLKSPVQFLSTNRMIGNAALVEWQAFQQQWSGIDNF